MNHSTGHEQSRSLHRKANYRLAVVAGGLAMGLVMLALGIVVPELPASASTVTALYAYPTGTNATSTTCPPDTSVTPTPSAECTLGQALADVPANSSSVIYLAPAPGSVPFYSPPATGFELNASGANVAIEPLNNSGYEYLQGAGADASPDYSTLSISGTSDNVLIDSVAFDAGMANDGGAVDVTASSSNVTIDDSLFEFNVALTNGGAIDAADGGGSSTLVLSNDIFTDNSAQGDGGAVSIGEQGGSATMIVSDSLFTGNSSGANGGAIDAGDVGAWSSLSVDDSTLNENTAANNGGAIDAGDGGATSLHATSCTFVQDTATRDGGAIDVADDGGALDFGLIESPTTYSDTAAGDGRTFVGPPLASPAQLSVTNQRQLSPSIWLTSTQSAKIGAKVFVDLSCSVENCSGTTQISALVNKKTTVLATGTYSLTAGTKGIEDLQMTHSGAADLARATLASPIKVTLVISLVNGANLSKPLNII